jgi:TrmH family RNA methyltransferase
MEIISTSNPRIKAIRKLKDRKERSASGLFYLEGLRIVISAFEKNAPVETLIYNQDLLQNPRGQQLLDQARQKDVEILEVSQNVFAAMALKENPQGLAAVARQHVMRLDELEDTPFGLWTALDEIADPGNLGTIMRTMDAVGGKGILLIGPGADPYDPSAVRASMGAIFSLKLVKASLQEFVPWKRSRQIKMVGTSDRAAQAYNTLRYPSDLLLLMGSERQGMQLELEALCDEIVRIPMAGSSDSLNLSIANAVVLYEIFNQHHATLRG